MSVPATVAAVSSEGRAVAHRRHHHLAAAAQARATERPTSLWRLADVRRLLRVLVLSGTGLVVAWLVASGTTDPARQEQAVAGAIVAASLALAGLTGWVLTGMRTVRVLRDDDMGDVRALLARRTATPAAPASRVTVTGTSHHHDPSCLMVRGKAVRAARGRTLTPCPVCTPEETT